LLAYSIISYYRKKSKFVEFIIPVGNSQTDEVVKELSKHISNPHILKLVGSSETILNLLKEF